MTRIALRTGALGGDREIRDAASSAFDDLRRAAPILDGVLHIVELVSGRNDIRHGLGRAWRGYIVCGMETSVSVDHDTSPDESQTLRLNAGGATAARIWVF